MLTSPRIWLYADAGRSVGLGHLFRLLPLFQALRKLAPATRFFCPLEARGFIPVGEDAVEVMAISRFTSLLRREKPDVLVVDSYRHVEDLLRPVPANRMVIFDDHYSPPNGLAAIVNGSPVASGGRYGDVESPLLLLGSRYVSMSTAFRSRRKAFRVRKAVSRVLVALGGQDTAGQLGEVTASLLRAYPEIRFDICGAAHQRVPESPRVHRVPWAGQAELAKRLAQSDLAVLGAGQMLLQAACVGVPVIALPQSPNQKRHAAAWQQLGICRPSSLKKLRSTLLGLKDYELRRKMSRSARQTIDGSGAIRIARLLLKIAARMPQTPD